MNQTTFKPLAFSYLRMSTEMQLKGDSRRRQSELSKAFAEAHDLDLADDRQLEDIGVSAFKGANSKPGAQFGDFLKAVDAGNVPAGSWLLVESLDRLSREHPKVALEKFLRLINAGIIVATLSDKRIYDHNVDTLELFGSLMIMARSHEESRTKSNRIRAAWGNKRKLASNKPMSSNGPAWLRLKSDRSSWEVIEDRAVIVRRIFEDAASGVGMYTIARRLNAGKVPTFNKSNGWHMSYVQKILNNRAVLGEFQPHEKVDGARLPDGPVIPNYYPAIISEDAFFRAQHGRRERALSGRGRKGPGFTNIFGGLATCAYCGSRMTLENKGNPPKGTKSLVCINSQRHLNCDAPRWRYNHFETAFFAFVRELDLSSLLLIDSEANRRAEIEASVAALNGQISSIRSLMDKTLKLLEKNTAVDYVSEKLAEFQSRIDDLQESLDEQLALQADLIAQNAAFSAAKLELRETIERLQSGPADDAYRLRSKIAVRLKSLVQKLEVGSAGEAETIRRIIREMESRKGVNLDRLGYLRRQLSNPSNRRPYFSIIFKDGGMRYVIPDEKDPLKFHQQFVKRGISTIVLRPDELGSDTPKGGADDPSASALDNQ